MVIVINNFADIMILVIINVRLYVGLSVLGSHERKRAIDSSSVPTDGGNHEDLGKHNITEIGGVGLGECVSWKTSLRNIARIANAVTITLYSKVTM